MDKAIKLEALDSFECGVVGTISDRQVFTAGPVEAQQLVEAGLAERLPDEPALDTSTDAEAIDVTAREVLLLPDTPPPDATPLLSPKLAARRSRAADTE